MKQIPFIHLLFRQVGLFILIPIILVISYSLIMAYRAETTLMKNAIQSRGYAVASDINGKLTRYQYATIELSQNKGLAEVAKNILYSQFVDKSLQQFVQHYDGIESAFIMDEKGFVVSGYPLVTLRAKSPELQQIVQRKLANTHHASNLPELHYFDGAMLNLQQTSTSLDTGHLVFITRLQRETESIINPMETNSMLFVVLSQEQLLQVSSTKSTDLSSQEYNVLSSREQTLSTIDVETKTYANNPFLLELPIWINDRPMPLSVINYHQTSNYFLAVYQNIAVTLLALLIIFVVTYYFLRVWMQKLNTPIREMVQLSHQIAKGNYKLPAEQNPFIEFHQIHDALKKMALQISNQIFDLQEARLKAESSDKLKSQFLANMSHEIRTPMNGVLGVLQLLEQQITDPRQAKMLDTAITSGGNLMRILNDILDLSKIEAEQLEIEHVAFNPKLLIEDVCDLSRANCQEKGLVFNVRIDEQLNMLWSSDSLRISQILYNLLSNAVKFTAKGCISFEAHYCLKEGRHLLQCSISDQGIGISPSQLKLLFTPFKQADASTTREFGGTGLGLVICKKLVELMHGEFSVVSEPGVGSCFTFNVELQQVVVTHPEPSVQIKDERPPNLQDKRILIAEDNMINQEIIKLMLEDTQAKICLVNNGEEALEAYQTFLPDLILMDVQMPIMDGVTAIQQLRAQGMDQPIVMLTANVSQRDVSHYLSIGADQVLGKPTQLEELYTVLRHFLTRTEIVK
ncbi:ATP-binding protein [Flavobacterium sp. W21_SRS_FM6]|uniref:ATP-binding protein n=1 Tax=Flavobacterium sp. W21_SRS_FM6 TaxID=3240268 RepID=UPI003F8F1AF8